MLDELKRKHDKARLVEQLATYEYESVRRRYVDSGSILVDSQTRLDGLSSELENELNQLAKYLSAENICPTTIGCLQSSCVIKEDRIVKYKHDQMILENELAELKSVLEDKKRQGNAVSDQTNSARKKLNDQISTMLDQQQLELYSNRLWRNGCKF